MGHEAGLYTLFLHGIWHGRKGPKGGGEEIGYSSGREVAEIVLQDG